MVASKTQEQSWKNIYIERERAEKLREEIHMGKCSPMCECKEQKLKRLLTYYVGSSMTTCTVFKVMFEIWILKRIHNYLNKKSEGLNILSE
jgi:hypothetical protein